MPAEMKRATIGEELRAAMIEHVMARDNLQKAQATAIVNAMHPTTLTRLEMELRDRGEPAFTSDYDPFARG